MFKYVINCSKLQKKHHYEFYTLTEKKGSWSDPDPYSRKWIRIRIKMKRIRNTVEKGIQFNFRTYNRSIFSHEKFNIFVIYFHDKII